MRSITGIVITLLGCLVAAYASQLLDDNAAENGILSNLVKGLKHNETDIRRKAAADLAKLGENAREALPALIEATKDDDERVRYFVKLSLSRIGQSSLPGLTKELSNKDARVRSAVAESLGLMAPVPKAAVSALLEALRDKNSAVRANAAFALGRCKDDKAIAPLVDLLKWDKNPDARWTTIVALGEFGAKSKVAIPLLLKIVKDPASYERKAPIGNFMAVESIGSLAARSLGQIGPDSAIPLAVVFKDPNCGRMSRLTAAWGLEQMGPKASPAVETLIYLVHDGDIEVRERAIRTLGSIGARSREANQTLIKSLDDPAASVRIWAAVALYQIDANNQYTVTALIKGLKDKESSARFGAAQQLELLGPKAHAALVDLVDALADQDPEVRRTVARALGQIGPAAKGAIPSLEKALKDQNQGVRESADKAIKKIRKDR
jgi:HEAT repeat protein